MVCLCALHCLHHPLMPSRSPRLTARRRRRHIYGEYVSRRRQGTVLHLRDETIPCDLKILRFAFQILCWELVSKRGGSWILHYVKSAYAITDVPDQVRLFVYISLPLHPEVNPTGPRTHLPAPSLAQRLLLRCRTQHSALLLYI